MTANKELRVVYVTSGIDELVQQFHSMPGVPVAILEITDRDIAQTFRVAARSIASRIWPQRYPDLSRYCKKHGIQHIAFPKVRRSVLHETVNALNVDLLVSYRSPFLPMDAINAARLGGINVHFSVLPDYRGGDPLLWQVLHGEENAGVTVHKLTDKIDYGVMLEQDTVKRTLNLDRTELRQFVNSNLSQRLLHNAIAKLQNGTAVWSEQAEIDNPIPAPNTHAQFWRQYIEENSLSDAHIQDIKCFVGEGN